MNRRMAISPQLFLAITEGLAEQDAGRVCHAGRGFQDARNPSLCVDSEDFSSIAGKHTRNSPM